MSCSPRLPASASPPRFPRSGEHVPALGMGSWITFNVGDDEALRTARADPLGWGAGLALTAYGLIDYPVIFGLLGYGWSAVPLVGLAPVPTTLFTLGVLLLIEGRTPWHLLVIPVAWSLIDGWTAWVLGIPEDLVLPAAGIATAGIVGWGRQRRVRRS